jgi:signal transduction histidine kinase
MSVRAKLYPALVVACIVALALLCFAQYHRGARAFEETLRADAEARAARLSSAFATELRERERDLADFAGDARTRTLARALAESRATVEAGNSGANPAAATNAGGLHTSPNTGDATPNVNGEMRALVASLLARGGGCYAAVTVAASPRASIRFKPLRWQAADGLSMKPGDVSTGSRDLDELISTAATTPPPRATLSRGLVSQGVAVYSAPIADAGAGDGNEARATLIAELNVSELLARAAEGLAEDGAHARTTTTARPRDATGARQSLSQLLALDHTGLIVFHSSVALKFKTVASMMPYFGTVAAEMYEGRRGAKFFDDADGARWLAAYEPVPDLDLTVAAASNETAMTAQLRRDGLIYVALSIAFALTATALVITREVRAVRRIERVARAARAVAEGDMDKRLETSAHDRTRSIAESFNLMTERLRGHIRREAENRQFQAFIRLSAMLTHDLKNAITGLSMLVTNMEQKFHREEFRADAISSLREATDKLRALVARLSKPTETLSGEYRSALKPVDLVALIRRVLDSTAGRSSFHEVELHLPDALEVVVDAERVERVVENLIINALEAMGAKPGKLTVEAGRAGDDQVFINVADTGAGMSAEFVRTKLFQPFATTKKQGLGLGLYTCREVIEAHGGRIDVESKQGSGTCFRIVLPSRPVSLRREKKTV